MTTPVTIRGVTINYPTAGDTNWAQAGTQFAQLTASAVAPINDLYNSNTGHVGLLALNDSDLLTVNGVVVGTGSISGAIGQVLVSSGTGNAIPLAYGTSGQVLTSAGAGLAPAYVNQSAIIAGNGIQPVSSLPITGDFTGQVVYLLSDGLLYRWNGSAWISTLPTAQLTGLIENLQIADAAVTAAKTALAGINSLTGEVAANAVNVTQLVNGAVTALKLADGSVTAAKTAVAAIDSLTGNLANGTVNTSQIVAGAVNAAALANAAVTASKTALAAIDSSTGNLAVNSVTSNNITAGSVIAGKIATNAVVAGNIAAGAITAGTIAAGAITATELAANSVVAGKIAANAVTAVTIAAGEVTAGKLATDSVVAANIQAGAVVAGKLAANSVDAINIVASAITAGKIATDAIVTNNIQAGQVTGVKIAAGTITAANIAAGTITASNIAASTITGSNIAAGTITASNIAAGTITATQISTGTITATQMAAGTITAASGIIASIDATKITSGSIRGINIQSGAFITKGTYLAVATSGGETTITVGDTSDFPASGDGLISGDTVNNYDQFTYTGKTSTTLTGCSGILAHTVNAIVAPYTGSTSSIIAISAVDNAIEGYGNLTGTTLSPTITISPRGTPNYAAGDAYFITGGSLVSTGSGFGGIAGYSTSSGYAGVYGRSTNAGGYGVYGTNSAGYGVYGNSTATGYAGVRGTSGAINGQGVYGQNTGGSAVSFIAAGVHGQTDGPAAAIAANVNTSAGATGPHFNMNPLAARPTSAFVGSFALCYTTGGGVGTRTGTPRLVMYDGANWLLVGPYSVFSG